MLHECMDNSLTPVLLLQVDFIGFSTQVNHLFYFSNPSRPFFFLVVRVLRIPRQRIS
jgi:hypothetical protein